MVKIELRNNEGNGGITSTLYFGIAPCQSRFSCFGFLFEFFVLFRGCLCGTILSLKVPRGVVHYWLNFKAILCLDNFCSKPLIFRSREGWHLYAFEFLLERRTESDKFFQHWILHWPSMSLLTLNRGDSNKRVLWPVVLPSWCCRTRLPRGGFVRPLCCKDYVRQLVLRYFGGVSAAEVRKQRFHISSRRLVSRITLQRHCSVMSFGCRLVHLWLSFC